MKFDPKDLRRLAELVVRNLDRIAELTKEYHADYVVTNHYDEMGRWRSETVKWDVSVDRPRLSIDIDGTVTQIDADGTETVIATFE